MDSLKHNFLIMDGKLIETAILYIKQPQRNCNCFLFHKLICIVMVLVWKQTRLPTGPSGQIIWYCIVCLIPCLTQSFLFCWKSNAQKHSLCHIDNCLLIFSQLNQNAHWIFLFIFKVVNITPCFFLLIYCNQKE